MPGFNKCVGCGARFLNLMPTPLCMYCLDVAYLNEACVICPAFGLWAVAERQKKLILKGLFSATAGEIPLQNFLLLRRLQLLLPQPSLWVAKRKKIRCHWSSQWIKRDCLTILFCWLWHLKQQKLMLKDQGIFPVLHFSWGFLWNLSALGCILFFGRKVLPKAF